MSAIVWLLVCAASVRAQEEKAEPYSASAAVTRERFEHSRSVLVVSRKELEQTAAGEVGDMLERAPSVVVQRTASGSAVPILRGLSGSQVLLLLDDIRLNDALTRAGGGAALSLVDPESVAQIEVVRGPASVLYGSDALGGVVHVRTEQTKVRNEMPSLSATAALRGATGEQALRAQGALSGSRDGVGARFSFGRGYAGNVYRGEKLGSQPFTGHQDWTASGKLEARLASQHMLSLAHHSGHLFDMPRSDVSTPEDVQRTAALDRDGTVLTYHGSLLQRRLRLHAYAGVSRRYEQRERVRPGRHSYESERVRSVQAGLRVSGTPWRGGSLELGFETTLDRVASGAHSIVAGERKEAERGRYVNGSSYDMHALYVLLSQQLFRRWTVLLGARGTLVIAEAPPDPLFAAMPGADATLDQRFARPVASLGVRVQLSSATALIASVLGGFRAPNLEDFQAFGGAARGYTVPNLRLSEERSWTFEAGFEHVDSRWDVRAYAFASLLSGLIVRVPSTLNGMTEVDGEPVIARRNASHSLLTGGELALSYGFDAGFFTGAAGSLTWGETKRPDEAGNNVKEPAAKVPAPLMVLRAGYERADVPYFANIALMFQTKQERLSEGDRQDVRLCPDGPEGCDKVPGFVDLTFRAGVRITEHILASVAVENVLDRAYRTYASGAYAPGRNFVAYLRVRR